MRVFAYGTLKRGGGNDAWAFEASTYVQDHVVQGYKLYNAGFPVAAPSGGDSVRGEIWDIGDPSTDERSAQTIRQLDRLEGNGFMYQRQVVDTVDGEEIWMYIGMEPRWNFATMDECPIEEGSYEWGRERCADARKRRART